MNVKHVVSNSVNLILSWNNTKIEVSRVNPVAEVNKITCNDIVTNTDATTYFVLVDTYDRFYYVWLNVDGEGEDPMPHEDWIGVPVSVSTGDTASDVASEIQGAINVLGTFLGTFTATVSAGTVTVTNNPAGKPVMSPYDVDTGFTITNVTRGVDENQVIKSEAPWNDVIEIVQADLQDASSADLYAVVKISKTKRIHEEKSVTEYIYDYRTITDWFIPA